MSWEIGWEGSRGRWVGYGVPAHCEHPDCDAEIDRGLSYVCGGEPFGGDHGCGMFFCTRHLEMRFRGRGSTDAGYRQLCQRCARGRPPFPEKPEHPKWARHLLKDPTWAEWRGLHPELVEKLKS